MIPTFQRTIFHNILILAFISLVIFILDVPNFLVVKMTGTFLTKALFCKSLNNISAFISNPSLSSFNLFRELALYNLNIELIMIFSYLKGQNI